MRHIFRKLYDAYAKVLLWVAMLAGIATFAIMCLIFANALLRKLFNAPIPASLEITQALLVAVIMLPFAYTQWRREHVNTVFFTAHLPRATQRALQCVFQVVGFLLFAAVTYGTFHYALRSYNINEMAWGATVQFPVWPAKMMVCLGTLMISIQFLLDAIHTVLFDSADDLDQVPEMAANV